MYDVIQLLFKIFMYVLGSISCNASFLYANLNNLKTSKYTEVPWLTNCGWFDGAYKVKTAPIYHNIRTLLPLPTMWLCIM